MCCTAMNSSGSPRSAVVIARSRPTCSGCSHPVSCRPQSACEMNATVRPSALDRVPPPGREQKGRAFDGANVSQRGVLIEDLEPIELDHELAGGAAVRIERRECARLDHEDRGHWWGFDA